MSSISTSGPCACCASGYKLFATGLNSSGQLGLGDTTDRATFTQIGTDADWMAVSVSFESVWAIKANGSLWFWGNQNFYGSSTSPTQVGTDTDWAWVDHTVSSVFAIKTDGTLWALGNGPQLGLGDYAVYSVLTQVGTDTDWRRAFGLDGYCLAIKTNGRFYGAGYSDLWVFTEVTHVPGDYLYFTASGTKTSWAWAGSSGMGGTLNLKTDGTLWFAGYDNYGELGDAGTTSENVYTQRGASTWGMMDISLNGYALGIKTDGTLWVSGDATTLTNNTYTNFTQIGSASDWSALATFGSHAMLVKTDGTLWTLGTDNFGESGQGTFPLTDFSPVQVGSATNWAGVGTGYGFTIALQTP